MKTIECTTMYAATPDENKTNGGYRTLGDGVGDKRMLIKQGLQGMILNEDDIVEVRKALSFFDPRM